MESPFVFGKIAEGAAFANRRQELQRISANFRNKINTVILGNRRFGKTSLIKKIAAEYSGLSFYRVVYLDAYKVHDEESFYAYFAGEVIRACSANLDECIENSRQFISKSTSRMALGLAQQRDYSVSFSLDDSIGDDALNVGNEIARKKNFILIVCIDNFQHIEKFENNLYLQKKLKTYFEQHEKTVYCISGTQTAFLQDAFTNSEKPLYQFGDLLFLEKINAQEFGQFIHSRFSETGKSVTIPQAERIATEVDCHPYYTQQLAHIVWMNSYNRADDQVIRNSVEDLVSRNLIPFQKEFENLSVLQSNFIRALLDGVQEGYTTKQIIDHYRLSSSAAVVRVIDSLIKKEIIEKREGKYHFVDPVFLLWLNRFVLEKENDERAIA